MREAALLPGRLHEAELDAVREALEAFAAAVPGVRGAVVASVDGFALAEAATAGNGERLAAMTSSMLGLAKAVARELDLGAMEALMIEAGDGKVLMLSIPAPASPLLLMAACNRRSVMGHALWNARECARRILSACRAG